VVDKDVVAAKLAELARRVERVRANRPGDERALAEDPDALDLVSFNLMLAVQTCLDLASHLIADEGWPPAGTLAAAFHRLQEHGVLSHGTAAALGEAAKFRNLVAHDQLWEVHGPVLVARCRIRPACRGHSPDITTALEGASLSEGAGAEVSAPRRIVRGLWPYPRRGPSTMECC